MGNHTIYTTNIIKHIFFSFSIAFNIHSSEMHSHPSKVVISSSKHVPISDTVSQRP